ncbi:hypothetical protein LR48_Vigan197s000600 [Vigna angularis]|uniref:Ubiquitin-like protease family profile domain-containing protein n=1 Tax=Phaseolus angularis TaxID=3914 RepID=A0A0L9T5H8_PHAAN|nr:hypothetical protein LR48_Vigan197s000600 [Vigna angularis]
MDQSQFWQAVEQFKNQSPQQWQQRPSLSGRRTTLEDALQQYIKISNCHHKSTQAAEEFDRPPPQQWQQQPSLSESLDDTLQRFLKNSISTQKRIEASCKRMEMHLRYISQRLNVKFTRPQKQPIHDTVIHEDDDMAEAEDDPLSKLMTKLPRLKKAPLELYWDLRVFGLPPHVPVYITLSDALEVIGGDRMLNISIIQLWCMYMDTIVVDQVRSFMYEFVEPQTIQPFGNTLENRQHYLQTWMDESKRDVYLVPYIDGLHWQLMVIIPKACKIIWFCSLHRKMKNDFRTMLQGLSFLCNMELDSWECGFYVMCWIKTIIRAVITNDWNERLKSTSPILEDTIRQIRQELTAYLLQRWS